MTTVAAVPADPWLLLIKSVWLRESKIRRQTIIVAVDVLYWRVEAMLSFVVVHIFVSSICLFIPGVLFV